MTFPHNQDNEKRTALHAAVSKSPWSLHIVRMLVEREANVNLADEFGYTCLHVAALNELDECVEYLIMQGANVAARTHGNVSALNIINRKTPVSVKTIPRRLDLAMSYKEQNLKLNFRDILRNSPVGEIGFLHALQKEGQSQVGREPEPLEKIQRLSYFTYELIQWWIQRVIGKRVWNFFF